MSCESVLINSPLIRDRSKAREVRPISPGAIWHTVHSLYAKAGLIQTCPSNKQHRRGTKCQDCGYPERPYRRQPLRVHSLRYYFRTQLTSLGVNPEYAEFMMGHKGALYHDIQSRGIEFLRNVYSSSGISIRPKPQLDRVEGLKVVVRSLGYDLEKILVREALSEPHRIVTSGNTEDLQVGTLTGVLRQALQELAQQYTASSSVHYGSPGEIGGPSVG